MAKISIELLKSEYKNYLKIKSSIDRTPYGKMTSFGKKMNKRYLFGDDLLSAEKDPDQAIMIIVQNHIEKL